MTCEIQGIPIYYEQYGEGKPIVFIHGWPVDHGLMSGCFELVFNQLQGYCRIYLDLPGMGKTPSAKWIKNSDNTLKILIKFINNIIGDKNFLLAGESYGGYLTIGLIYELANRIDGVFLLCPMLDSVSVVNKVLPKWAILYSESLEMLDDDADVKSFMDMAVIATPEIYKKYKNDILPGIKAHDKEFLSNYYKGEYNPDFEKKLRETTFDKPSCILTGRQDNWAGYSIAYEILERFPRATLSILDCAGHNLQIENEPIFIQMVKDWLWRVDLENIKLTKK